MSAGRKPRATTAALAVFAILLLPLAFLLLVNDSGLAAQDEPAASVSFGELAASPTFPTTIDFHLAAQAETEIVRAELLFAPRWDDTWNLIEAPLDPGQRIDLTFPLDMYTNYFPPGLDILYRWRLTDAGGTVAESPEQTVLWLDTRFAWQSIATEQVEVFYYTGNEGFNRQILDSAQGTIDELQAHFGVERSRPLRIWVYNSEEDFGGAQEPNSEPWIGGVSYPGRYLILGVIPDGNAVEVARVVPHEVSHQVLYQATENPFNLPATWLDEGLATYHQDADKVGYAATLRNAVENGSLLPLASISFAFPYDETTRRLAYAEGLSVVEFILAEWGEEAMAALIAAYGNGVSHDEAVMHGLGIDLAALDARWKAHLGYAGDRLLDDGTGGAIAIDRSDGGWPVEVVLAPAAAGAAIALGFLARIRRRPSNDRLAA